jgi:hypothetical protein
MWQRSRFGSSHSQPVDEGQPGRRHLHFASFLILVLALGSCSRGASDASTAKKPISAHVVAVEPREVRRNVEAAQRSAVAVTIIGGQTLCLLPTLLVTPVAYSLFAELSGSGARDLLRSLRPSLARRFTFLG